MSESVIIAILGAASTLLAATLSFVFGRRYERVRQTLVIRAQMLEPIMNWLAGADKMINIMGDTFAAVGAGLAVPVTYNLEERRKAAQFMSENTNPVLGILASKSLQVGRARKLAKELTDTVIALDGFVRIQLLPLDREISDRARPENLTTDFLQRVYIIKTQGDALIKSAHSLITQIKVALA
ncbi:MAG: hypothetical protein AB1531_13065 [Chloroflexota bacterium]